MSDKDNIIYHDFGFKPAPSENTPNPEKQPFWKTLWKIWKYGRMMIYIKEPDTEMLPLMLSIREKKAFKEIQAQSGLSSKYRVISQALNCYLTLADHQEQGQITVILKNGEQAILELW